MEWLEWTLWDNTIQAWLLMLGIVAGVLLFLALFKWLFSPRLRRAAETETRIDDLLLELTRRTRLFLLMFVVAFFATRPLALRPAADHAIRAAAVVAILLQVGLWALTLLDLWLKHYREIRLESDAAAVTTIGAIGFMAKIVLWSILTLLALANLGFDVTALVTGLGVGGVAIALATQNILGDLFASLSIVIDKPFIIGDFIIIGDFAGTVEQIGLKTTRIRSLSGEQLIFSNSDLLSSRIRNFKRMAERRVLFSFGVIYQTSSDQTEAIPAMVRELIDAEELTRFDRAHLKGFGDSSLDFEVVYYVLQPDYGVYMDIQQRINLGLMRRFEKEGIGFAYPTRTLFIESNLQEAWGAPGEGAGAKA